ncbi:MAG: NADH-quinone oxidoreductase subunit H, partial [Ktedonobacterales bacterium]
TAAIQVAGTLEPPASPIVTQQKYFVAGALALGAIAFACALPVLARTTAIHEQEGEAELSGGEVNELSGRDLACFRVGEALQLLAAAAVFVTVFVLPLIRLFSPSLPLLTQGIILAVALLLTAGGVGAWDGFHTRLRAGTDRPPLTWWLGAPLLLALAALVAAAWATRGV